MSTVDRMIEKRAAGVYLRGGVPVHPAYIDGPYKPFRRMNVYFAEENGRFAQFTLRTLSDWKKNLAWPEIHVVHWNNGLWDALHMDADPDDGDADGGTIFPENVPSDVHFDKDPLTPPETYRYMLVRVLKRVRWLFPGAEVVFATSTPVIEEKVTWGYISNAELVRYNRIAAEALAPRGVRVNDLGAFAAARCGHLHRDWIHYNEEGCALFADEIVRFLETEHLI